MACAASVVPYHPMSPDFLDEILDAELLAATARGGAGVDLERAAESVGDGPAQLRT